MKLYMRYLFIMASALLAMGRADGEALKVEVLNDSVLAAVRGGFCPFEECESTATGLCQPVVPDKVEICAVTKCIYDQEILLGVRAYGCILFGDDTCTEPEMYKQCVWAFKLSYCEYGAVPLCGELVQGDCNPIIEEEVCVCSMYEPGTPCNWTDCIP